VDILKNVATPVKSYLMNVETRLK